MSAAHDTSRRRTLALYGVLAALAVLYIAPFLIDVATSFKTEPEAASNPTSLIPGTFTTAAYERLFLKSDFPLWFQNSAIVTVLVTLGRILFNSMAGYALARIPFRGRTAVFALLIAVMAVPNVVLLIPRFLVVSQLGMFNTYSGLVVPLLVDAAGIFIMKNFFESIPASVEEQARIDGAGTFRIFWSVVLPMARPAVVTLTILSFQGSWNELSHFVVASNERAALHPHQGRRRTRLGQSRSGHAVPAQAGRGSGDDDPGRDRVPDLPEADHEREQRRGQGVAQSEARASFSVAEGRMTRAALSGSGR